MVELIAKQIWVEDGHATQGMWWDHKEDGTIRFVHGSIAEHLVWALKEVKVSLDNRHQHLGGNRTALHVLVDEALEIADGIDGQG